MGRARSDWRLLVYMALAGVLVVAFTAAKQDEQALVPGDEERQDSDVTASLSAEAAVQVFAETLRRYQRIQFDELVTGDASLFPTIFHNDPRYPVQGEGWVQAIDAAGPEAIQGVIDRGEPGPIGVGPGFLSAKIAAHLQIWENIEAWASIEATATAEGRSPSFEEVNFLPRGELPYPRKHRGDWVVVPMYVFDVVVEGEHATAKWAYIEPEDAVGDWITSYGDVYQVFWFTLVDGQWYISGEQSVLCPCTNDPPVKP